MLRYVLSLCIRRELLKSKLTNQNSASGKNCAIRRHANCLHSDWLDRWTFAQPSLVTLLTGASLNFSETEISHCSDNQFANPLYPVYGWIGLAHTWLTTRIDLELDSVEEKDVAE